MFSLSGFIIILSLMFSSRVHAENEVGLEKNIACTMDAKLCPDGSSVGRTGPNCEFVCPSDNAKDGEIKNKFREIKGSLIENREETKMKRGEFKGEVKEIKNDLREQKEVNKNRLEQMVELVKVEREKFKVEFELNKEKAKQKIEETKATFKESLKKIKDEKKVVSAGKIVDIILGLNIKITSSLSDKTDQIENVLVSVESRTTKAEASGLEVTSVRIKIEEAKKTITSTREAINIQSKKNYEIGVITDELTLKMAMKNLRDTFTKDIKSLREQIKKAHIAVREATTTLAQIPKIDDIKEVDEPKTEDTTKVEDNNTEETVN